MHIYDPFAHCGMCDTHIKCYKQEILQGLNCLLFIITGCLWNVSTFLFAEKGFLMIAHNADPGVMPHLWQLTRHLHWFILSHLLDIKQN